MHFIVTVHLRDVDYYYDQWSNCSTTELESTNAPSKRMRAMARIQQNLIAAQELGDEKLQVVTQLQGKKRHMVLFLSYIHLILLSRND